MITLSPRARENTVPVVSVIIPAYNAARYVGQAVASVLIQNSVDYEIIVVDDGSTDNTGQALLPYADYIRYVKQENAGPSAARNVGLDLALGEFVQFLDADDCLLPDKFRQQVAQFRVQPNLGIVHSGWLLIDESGNHLAKVEPWRKAPELDLITWIQYKCVKLGPMLIRRLWLDSVGAFDPDLHHAEDLDLILRLSLEGCQAGWLCRTTMKYRVHGASTLQRNAIYQAQSLPRVLDKFYSYPSLPDIVRQREHHTRRFSILWLAWYLYRFGNLDQIAVYLEEVKRRDDRPAVRILFEWLSHFVKWSADSGWTMENPVELWGTFRQTLGFSGVEWQHLSRVIRWWMHRQEKQAGHVFADPYDAWQLYRSAVEAAGSLGQCLPQDAVLSWWSDIWCHYLSHDEIAVTGYLDAFVELDLDQCIRLAQVCLVIRPPEDAASLILRFWSDLVYGGLVNEPEMPRITTLWLTAAGQALLGRHWLSFWSSFRLALTGLIYDKGRASWRRFVISSASYFRQNRRILAESGASDVIPDRMLPRVSIVIPTYNNADYILSALQSVFDQDFDDYEIVVVDDGSTDDTAELLRPMMDSISYIYQDNAGSASARNTGIAVSSGEYVVLLDADDLLMPGKLAAQVAILDKRQHIGAVHSGWRLIDENGTSIRDVEPWKDASVLNLESWIRWKPVKMGAMLFRREWLDRVGCLDPDLQQSHDVDLMLRLSLAGCQMQWHYEPTLCYRQHRRSTMRKGALEQARCALLVLDRFFARPDLPRKIKRRQQNTRYFSTMWVAWHLFRTSNFDDAVSYLKETKLYAPYGNVRAVMDWLRHFARWSYLDGRPLEELRLMWPYFRQAAELQDSSWRRVAGQLDWWLDVWWYYLRLDYTRANENLSRSPSFSTKDLVAMIQFYLIVSPLPATSQIIERFWADAIENGLVKWQEKPQVTVLFLTLFGQAILARNARAAVSAFMSALTYAYYPQSWCAWGRFVRAGLVFFSRYPWRTDKVLVGQM